MQRVRLGISACLMGQPVRYDGGHKRNDFLLDALGAFVDWVPVCPEMAIGLGSPRDPIRLVGSASAPRLVVERTGEDLTGPMERFATRRVRELEELGIDGYVLKANSPSCGRFDVPVHLTGGEALPVGIGLFAAELVRRMPQLPIEEETRLEDPAICDRFVARALAARQRRLARSR